MWLLFNDFSQISNNQATNYKWKLYSNMVEVTEQGIDAGENIFVGGGTYAVNAVLSPTMLLPGQGKCYFSWGGKAIVITTGCEYLVNEPGKFKWIPSQNGEIVPNSVVYGGVPVGRVRHNGNGVMRVGKVSSGNQCIYYAYSFFELSRASYEVLTYSPIGTFL